MTKPDEKRRADRFETQVKVFYEFAYDIDTKINYQLVDVYKNKVLSKKYQAISKNISCEGLCFVAEQKLKKGSALNLEVYIPGDDHPISMQGEVCWSRKGEKRELLEYETGIHLTTINGEPVHDSVYFDKEYHVEWSSVLESVLGKYRIMAQDRKDNIDL